tara:strand:- start:179 stop:622 length:444 start_codon:yes stop_codon:yes gene_type:complete
MVAAFDKAWALLKADFNLWPKEENDTTPIKAKNGPPGHNVVDINNLDATSSHVNLPNIPQYEGEQGTINNVIEADIHEDNHKAAARVGHFYNNPQIDEFWPHIAEAEYRTRGTQFPMPLTEIARRNMKQHSQIDGKEYPSVKWEDTR